ncbi:hypothetical protein RUM44_013326 [Polyplax serrata]|uniref:Uncharacterized protein n=1 Tax=Polyplax serrata TaxID=468196 RepID=A0ABR1BDV7_POLSC
MRQPKSGSVEQEEEEGRNLIKALEENMERTEGEKRKFSFITNHGGSGTRRGPPKKSFPIRSNFPLSPKHTIFGRTTDYDNVPREEVRHRVLSATSADDKTQRHFGEQNADSGESVAFHQNLEQTFAGIKDCF